MALFAKIKMSKKEKAAADQQQKQAPAATAAAADASKATTPARPIPASAPCSAPSSRRASYDIFRGPGQTVGSINPSWRPNHSRRQSSASIQSRPAMTRSAASEPNLPTRGRIQQSRSDVSIDSVMMRNQPRSLNASPNNRQSLIWQTREPDFKPSMYTYDPGRAPDFSGRKRQRAYGSRPGTKRAPSFIRSPHIQTMTEESESEAQAGSSSSSTKSHSSSSTARSQYLEMKRTSSNRPQQQQEQPEQQQPQPQPKQQPQPQPQPEPQREEQPQEQAPPEIPARNPARNSVASARRTSTICSTRRPSTVSTIEAHSCGSSIKGDAPMVVSMVVPQVDPVVIADISAGEEEKEKEKEKEKSKTAHKLRKSAPEKKEKSKRGWFGKKRETAPISAH